METDPCATRRYVTEGGCNGRPWGLSQQTLEAGGSLSRETQVRVGAASATAGQAGTARRPGFVKQGEKVERK